jgi:parvulin-like peptidyl-prolyl isomerase
MRHPIRYRTSWSRSILRAGGTLSFLAAWWASPGHGAPPILAVRIAVEQIVVLHERRGKPRRPREESLRRAREVVEKVRSGALPFDVAVREYSDATDAASRGGYIGVLDRTDKTFTEARYRQVLFSLEIGEVSDPLETPAGVHVFRRVPIRERSGSHILIQFTGCERAPLELRRTREEALVLAKEVLAKARRGGTRFASLAQLHSEAPDAKNGGALGVFGPYEILPALEHAVAALKVNAISGPIETGLGFHIVKRTPIERRRVAQILVRFKGAAFDAGVSRNKNEARRRAETIMERARRQGADFAELAKRFSEDGTGATGGVLLAFGRGEMEPLFEEAAFALKVGEVSAPIETRLGFHVLLRLPNR